MSKINKYWGLVAVGAATAAVAGLIASQLFKKSSSKPSFNEEPDEDFDDISEVDTENDSEETFEAWTDESESLSDDLEIIEDFSETSLDDDNMDEEIAETETDSEE